MAEFWYSFYILAWNENQLNLPEIVQQSIEIGTLPTSINVENKLISITDRITTDALISDSEFLTAAPYIVIDRRVEYYERDDRNQDTESSPDNSNQSRREPRSSSTNNRNQSRREPRSSSTDNRNQSRPESTTKGAGTWTEGRLEKPLLTVSSARIGRYRLNLAQFQTIPNRRASCNSNAKSFSFSIPFKNTTLTLPERGELVLTAENTKIPDNPDWRVSGNSYTQRLPQYIFQGRGTPVSPEFGDKRTCYAVLPSNALVTVFGRLAGDILTPYQADDRQILSLVPGSRSEAIEILKNQYQWAKLLSRFVGFLLTWCGLYVMCCSSLLLPGRIPWLRRMKDPLIYCFWPAVAISIMSAVTAFFSHSVIPAITITIGGFVALAIRNWRLR